MCQHDTDSGQNRLEMMGKDEDEVRMGWEKRLGVASQAWKVACRPTSFLMGAKMFDDDVPGLAELIRSRTGLWRAVSLSLLLRGRLELEE